MSSGVNKARLSIGGVIFEYAYPKPDAAVVDKRLGQYILMYPWMTYEECEAKAFNDEQQKIEVATHQDIHKFVVEFLKAYNNTNTVGITQRLADPIVLADLQAKCPVTLVKVEGDISDTALQEPADVIDESNPNSINSAVSPSLLNKVPGTLVAKLNYEMDKQFTNLEVESGDKPYVPIDVHLSTPNPTKWFGDQMNDIALQMSGGGMPDATEAQELFALNRFNRTFVGPNRELQGWTFITRPHLNLSAENIANNPMFQAMLHGERDTFPHAARMWMDPVLCKEMSASKRSPLVDYKSPFFTPLCNRLISCNGWPDLNVGTETTEGGFFSENQTVAVGGDRLARGHDLTLTFKEMQGGLISSLFDWWCRYMIYIGDGSMHQRAFNIEHNLMGYTVSIYRFLTDHTGRNVTRWAKATGCFPKIAPIGTPFNLNQNEFVVTAGNEVSIQFQSHRPDYNNPLVLREFNKLVNRYNGYTEDPVYGGRRMYAEIAGHIGNNFEGFPWIETEDGHVRLVWLKHRHDGHIIGSGREVAQDLS